MLELWLIILTAAPPSAPPMLQEMVSPNCVERIEEWREQPGVIWARCETRRKPAEVEK